MTKKPGGLLFDLDGTLIDTAPDMGGALNMLLQQEGKPPIDAATIRPHVSHGSKALVHLGFGELEPEREQSLIRRYLQCYSQCVADNSVLFEGMDSLLQSLEAQDIAWGIITNKPTRFTVPLLQSLELLDRCSALVCGDSLAVRKPAPEPIQLACQRAGLTPDSCVYVGDAERDVHAGVAAGMRTVVMAWGYYPAHQDPRQWGTDWICADAQELMDVCRLTGLVEA
ncbi:MAG: phosphoglycolate phosphatase [Granulosicoccaceae bacterium]